MLVFIRNRNDRNHINVILCTDTSLPVYRVIQLYVNRWKIEEFFYCEKQLLKLISECSAQYYDCVCAHLALVNLRYTVLEFKRRMEGDVTFSFNQITNTMRDCLIEIPYIDAINTLVSDIRELPMTLLKKGLIAKSKLEAVTELVHGMLSDWFKATESYITEALTALRTALGSPDALKYQ